MRSLGFFLLVSLTSHALRIEKKMLHTEHGLYGMVIVCMGWFG